MRQTTRGLDECVMRYHMLYVQIACVEYGFCSVIFSLKFDLFMLFFILSCSIFKKDCSDTELLRKRDNLREI